MDAPDAGTLMTEPVLTVEPSASLSRVAAAMRARGINSIVAIDDDCRPVGTLTATDFVGIVGDGVDGETVGDHMTGDVETVPPAAAAREVAELMIAHDISHVPVVEDGTAIGIVTATDLTEYVAELEA